MHRRFAPRFFFILLAVGMLAAPLAAVPASAAPATPVSGSGNHLDAAVVQRLQGTPDSGLIPVIVEGASAGSAQPGGTARANAAEARVRNIGGRIVGSSSLLGAS